MEVLTASKAKTSFGSMLIKVQKSPVQIEKNGQPVAVLLSQEEYAELDDMKTKMLQMRYAAADDEKNLIDADDVFKEIRKGKG